MVVEGQKSVMQLPEVDMVNATLPLCPLPSSKVPIL